jgi:hypothetical protein
MKWKTTRSRWWIGPCMLFLLSAAAWGKEYPRWFDPSRHLPVEKVKPGMTGYGLSIFSGTTVSRFNVKILDVIHNAFEPRRSAILVEMTGQNLERTSVIEGMSGSPVYLKDPADGKDKIIGAVAFGWEFPCPGPAICGVQPIEQMMIISPEQAPKPVYVRTDRAFVSAALQAMASSSGKKPLKEFDRFAWAGLVSDSAEKDPPAALRDPPAMGLRPLATPLGISGVSGQTFKQLAAFLAPMNMTLLKTGTGSVAPGTGNDRLITAGVLAVPVVMGDLNLAAIGTVTDAIGDHVWGFGHSFFAQGPLELPLASGVIHAVIPNQVSSFKLGSSFKPVGTLYNDEKTGVTGKIGPLPKLVPLTVKVDFNGDTQTYQYQLALHEKLAPMLAMVCVHSSVLARNELPEQHVVRYSGNIQFGPVGQIDFANMTSDSELGMLMADIVEPINLMMNNDFERVKFSGVNVNIEIRPRSEQATIMQARLDKPQYRPGDTARIEVLFSRFRGPEFTQIFTFAVPKDLPDGEYQVTLGGIGAGLMSDRRCHPYLYKPTCIGNVFDMIKRVESFRTDRLYVLINTREEGLGIRCYGMPQLPGSKLQQLQEADPGLTTKYNLERVISLASRYVINGQDQLSLVISRNE